MQAQTFSLLLLAFLAATFGVRSWLALRQYRHVRTHESSVPTDFAERIPLKAHQRAAHYTRAKLRLGVVDLLVSVLLVLGLTLGGDCSR